MKNQKFGVKGLPWASGLGKDVSDCQTAREVIDKAKLNWFVKKCELIAKMPFDLTADNTLSEDEQEKGGFVKEGSIYRPLPSAFSTYRTDKNIPLGLVQNKYEVLQNIDAFNFFDDAIGSDKCQWVSAGSFGYGHKIFVTAKINFGTHVNADGIHDPIDNYLVFSNSHDGTSSLTIMFTPVRVFCTNCLNAGIERSHSYIRLRHTYNLKDKLEQGSMIMRMAIDRAKNSQELYQSLYTLKLSDKDALEYIANFNLTETEREALKNYDKLNGYNKILTRDSYMMEATDISTRKANIIRNMYEYYQEGAGQELILGTGWGLYNGITGYYSNVANNSGEKRMDSLLYGTANNQMQRALTDIRQAV